MQILQYFFKVLKRHALSVLIFLSLFLGLNILLADSEPQGMEAFTESSFQISIVNRDNHPISQGVYDYLSEVHTIVPLEDNMQAIQQALFFQDTTYVLIIEEGFGAAMQSNPNDPSVMLSNMVTPTAGIISQLIDRQIDNFLISVRAYLTAGFSAERAVQLSISYQTVEAQLLQHDEETQNSTIYFQMLPFGLISVMTLALGAVLMAYRRENLVRRMDVSATPTLDIKLRIMLGSIICALVIWLVFMIGAHIIVGNLFTEVGMLRVFNSLALAAFCVSLAFITGQLVTKSIVLTGVVNVVSLALSFISGVFVPQNFLSDGVLAAARFTPTYWYIHNHIMLDAASYANPTDMTSYLQAIGIQLGFAIAIFAVALVLGREKQSKS